MNQFPKGSEWRKWDLHIHSPLSILSNEFPRLAGGEPDWEPFLTKLESLDIAVVGVTDYFTIEGYKALKDFHEAGRLANIERILPNIEFRLNRIVSSRKDGSEKRINLHVIFSDEVSAQDIEEHFLHDLTFFYQADPQNKHENRKLKPANLEILGKELKAQHDPFKKMGDLYVGAMTAVVDDSHIVEILSSDSRFKGKYLIVLAADDWDDINWNGQAHLVRKGLLQASDNLFSSNPNTRQWCLGKPPYGEGPDAFMREFKTLKPCIHGSDAHRLEDIGRPCALRADAAHNCDKNSENCQLRFCWIKADPTFEGLKQLLYEPEDRVIIQPANPSPVISNYTLTHLDINGDTVNAELTVGDFSTALNSYLVAIVGGKGAGKTALVDLIANCYGDRINTEDKNSFVRRIAEYDADIDTTLQFKDGTEFEKELSEDKFIEASQLVYIAQGELEKHIGEESDLSQHITDLILHSPNIESSLLSFEFEVANTTTSDLEKQLSAKNEIVEDLENQTGPEPTQGLQREQNKIAADLNDVAKRILEFEKLQTKENIEAAQKRQASLGTMKANKDALTRLQETIEEAIGLLGNPLADFNRLIALANDSMRALGIGETFAEFRYPDRVKLDAVVANVKEQIKKVVGDVDREQRELEKLESGVREHARMLEQKRKLEEAEKSVTAKVANLKASKTKLADEQANRKELLKQLFESVIAQKEAYKAIITTFSADKADVLSDIDFVADIRFANDDFLSRAEGVLDNRKISVEDAFADVIRLSKEMADEDETKVDDFVDAVEASAGANRVRLKGQPITVGDLYDLLYRNHMTVVPQVKYKKTNLEKLSLGQKATVLIKIHLAHGDRPIIIDSHDDHLDNEFIMHELVNAIRQAKQYRQIILVSNNGNVVVNSDAEQIIIAERKGVNIEYVSGSLEDPEIRELALNVLEGGPEAFRKRQQKYRLGS
jgi:hypothetical protein